MTDTARIDKVVLVDQHLTEVAEVRRYDQGGQSKRPWWILSCDVDDCELEERAGRRPGACPHGNGRPPVRLPRGPDVVTSPECWMLACRSCIDATCEHSCHLRNLLPTAPSPAGSVPSPAGPGADPPATAVAAPANPPARPSGAVAAAATGATDGRSSSGPWGSGPGVPSPPAAPLDQIPMSSECGSTSGAAGTDPVNPARPAWWGERGCRFARSDSGHRCISFDGRPLKPHQVCLHEAKAAARDEMDRYRAVAG